MYRFCFLIGTLFFAFNMLFIATPASAIPYIQQIEVPDDSKENHLIKVKGGKISSGAGVASKIPGLEFLGVLKSIYGILAAVMGAIMFAAFKYAGSWEDKKYLKEQADKRGVNRALAGGGQTGTISAHEEPAQEPAPGTRRVIEKGKPMFGS